MANNSFNALLADVNAKISEMSTAIGDANSAAAAARDAAETANENAAKAESASANAAAAATSARNTATAWIKTQVVAQPLEAGEEPDVVVSDIATGKRLTFKIPVGANGADGPKGDTGRSGVTFQLLDTKLYITTD